MTSTVPVSAGLPADAASGKRLPSPVTSAGQRRILYVASSSRSGNTLLAFLLNTHPAICTVSHTTGWAFRENQDFRCSCGLPLPECPFFARMAVVFRSQGLPFEFNDFGTHYRVVEDDRLNNWLTAALPVLHSNRLERVRDAVTTLVPGFASRLRRQDLANQLFVEQSLAYNGASVFVDTSQTPHRLRHLRRLAGVEISAVHLVRDPRGVAASQRRSDGIDVALTARNWLRTQLAIVRVLEDFSPYLTVHYEDVCEKPAPTLASIHSFVGLEPHPLPADFWQSEHHILGNEMRRRHEKISRDERWKAELSPQEIRTVERRLEEFEAAQPRHPLAAIVRRYLGKA
jgi:hypothetical protein